MRIAGIEILILALLVVIGNTCLGQQKVITSYRDKENNDFNISLYGTIESLTQILNNNEVSSSDTTIYFFNSDGLPQKIIKTSKGLDVTVMEIIDERVIYYFDNGKLVSKSQWRIFDNENDIPITREIYEYDDSGNMVKIKYYSKSHLKTEKSFKFDINNRLIKKSQYKYGYDNTKKEKELYKKKSRYLSFVNTYKYDNSGNIIEETMDNIKGDIHKKYFYKYDRRGNLIEDGWIQNYKKNKSKKNYTPLKGYDYDENDNLIKKYDIGKFSPHNTDTYYIYDNQGNEIDVKGYYISNDTVLGYHYIYQYDQNGNQTREEEKKGNYKRIGRANYKIFTTQYDSNQNITLQEYYLRNNILIKMIKYIYHYDSYENWTMKEKYEGKSEQQLKKIETIYRKIEYFK